MTTRPTPVPNPQNPPPPALSPPHSPGRARRVGHNADGPTAPALHSPAEESTNSPARPHADAPLTGTQVFPGWHDP